MTAENGHGSVSLIVPGGYGRSIKVAGGRYVGVRDIKGGQCGDFWAIDAADFDHFLSPSHTWVHLGRILPSAGDELVTNRREAILTIIADDVGWHDMLVPACDKQRYQKYYGVAGHRNCCDNFVEAMRGHGWGKRPVPQPFNLFMNTSVEPDGTLQINDPISKAGDIVLMKALTAVIVVLSACPMDLNPVGGQGITDLEIIVGESKEDILEFAEA